ncbi:MAG: ABC transporter permease [Planctomycetes bacterium]|nr:ABC transporter permease [Planctomycetota bacterium]MCD7896122.1 ABC transporter permease [Planctomycetaceae bacterium]
MINFGKLLDKASLIAAWSDIVAGVKLYPIWTHYAWFDIKLRYRRSTLGPFWITINLMVMVLTVGLLYSKLFRMEIGDFLPYFAVGVTVWNLISNVINDSTSVFISVESLIRQVNLPYSLHIVRALARNIIIFLHSLIFLLACSLYFGKLTLTYLLYFPVMLLLLTLIFFFLSLIIAVFATRFRDMPQIILSVLQVLMLLTPIFWLRSILPAGMEYIYKLNPFYHFIEILRAPLLGQPIGQGSVIVSVLCLLILCGISIPFFAFYRKRIPYWL